MAGLNNLGADISALRSQNQSYKDQLDALQKSVSGSNVYHSPAYQQASAYQQAPIVQPTYTPYTPSTARWSQANTMPASYSPSTAVWTPPAGIPALLAAASAPTSGISGLAASGGK